ncbi:LysE family translocator [Thioalbus denitrificans]|uniref:Threonine/homoserine/homoserine lactone efflux protein n=1 Tax=Thioalbus denitrificans TaxID=547122 RepID=A0A369BY17_9GAMM|nr:LysE family translocator [Thioalbus denitrificans]RCX26602.1 threonine/homoserine/homoserine lactone efflux protein [Thioalbus denitrificans]
MNFESWLLFASIAFIATITPGPAILLATSHSLAYGLGRAVFTILGNISGLFVMSLLSVAGLSAIILGSSTVFTAVKLLGALYLVYLGLRLWRHGFQGPARTREAVRGSASPGRLYLNGLAVALSNPKAIAFTTALFPQFIDHRQGLAMQFGILVATFMLLSFGCLFAYAYLAESTKSRLVSSMPRIVSRIFATGFIASGVALAGASQRHA